MSSDRLYKLQIGDTFVISMKSYKNQEKEFKAFTEILRVESYPRMLLRCSRTALSYIAHARPLKLKSVIELFTRCVELKCVGWKEMV